jgi:hypothetical protein
MYDRAEMPTGCGGETKEKDITLGGKIILK